MHTLEESYKQIQGENYSLREYIIHLQSRLIESQGDFPQPPPNIDLRQPQPAPQMMQHHEAPTAPMGVGAMNALQASAAQAVAGLKPDQRAIEQAQAEDEAMRLRRQLQTGNDGLPRGP